MRLLKLSGRHIAKEQARQMSKVGWDQLQGESSRPKYTDASNNMKHMAKGMGHRLARMMKGHI